MTAAAWMTGIAALVTALTNSYLGIRHRRYDNTRFSDVHGRIDGLENGAPHNPVA